MIADEYQNKNELSISDFVELFVDRLTRDQVRYMIEKLVKDNILTPEGTGKGTKYNLTVDGSEGNLFDLIKKILMK